MTFSSRIRFAGAVLMAASAGLLASPGLQAQRVSEKQTIQSLYRALERLPQYGVFDFLSFTLDRGVVTLSGYSYTAQLKADAERAVKRVSGVDEVANRLEVLPVSQHDDRIRRDTFYRIYTDTSLSRYTSGGVQAVLREAYEFGRYPGMQPFGIYPIRIIVKGGRIMLVGSVDNSFDRQIAEVRAREVIGTFGVSNELTLPRSSAHLGK